MLMYIFLILSICCHRTSSIDDLLFDFPLPKSIYESLHSTSTTTSLQDPERWYNAGIDEMAKDSNIKSLFSAAYFFTAATHVAPQRAQPWHMLALSLVSLADGFSSDAGLVVLCEAKAAVQLSDALGNTAPSFVNKVLEDLDDYDQEFPLLCDGLPGGKQQAMLDHAEQLENEGKHLEATRLLCRTQRAMTITPTLPEVKRGVLTAATARRAWVISRICGVLKLSAAVAVDVLKEVKTSVDEHWKNKEKQITNVIASKELSNSIMYFESDDIAMRGDKRRFELQLDAQEPYTDPSLTTSPFVVVLTSLITQDDELELDTFSYVHSLPGSVEQPWHSDVEKLFLRSCDGKKEQNGEKEQQQEQQEHHIYHQQQQQPLLWKSSLSLPPTFGVVVVVPLIDVDEQVGPTEFMVGSHLAPINSESYWDDMSKLISEHHIETTPRVHFETKIGDVVMFDLRLLHRGTPNKGREKRPILYMSYVRNWYHDPSNFKRPQSRTFDQMPSKLLKRMFTRIDSKTYVRQLESLIEEMLGKQKLNEMRSDGKYTQRSVRI